MIHTLFVCSAARSGSTLLDMLLGMHPHVASLGEVNFFGKSLARDEACSCGAPVRTCPAWEPVIRTIRGEQGIDLLRDPYALRQWDTRMDNANADFNQQTKAYLLARALRKLGVYAHFMPALHGWLPLPRKLDAGLERAFQFYDLIRRLRQVDAVVDSSKEIHKAVAAYERDPAGVRLIWLIRDGRGVMYSRLHSGVRTGEAPERAIRQWLGYNARAKWMLEQYVAPEHVFQVRYEDLAANPLGVLNAILAWAGYAPLAALDTDRPLHIAGGNDGTKARFGRGVQADERWRQGLGADELALFERRAGTLNRELGYA